MNEPLTLKARVKVWFIEMRAPFFTAVIVPTTLGTSMAWFRDGAFDLLLFAVTLLGVTCLHAGTNIVNDYFDYKGGTDRINKNKSPFNGGSPFLIEGVLTPGQVYRAALAFFAAGSAVGLYLAYEVSYAIIPIGVAGVCLGYFYTAPIVNLAGRGIGEVAVGMGFGPLIVMGAYLVQTGVLDPEAFLAGLPVGVLIGLVLFINQFPDREADEATGKTHWVARMGLQKASLWYAGLVAVSLLLVPILYMVGTYPAWTLLALVPAFLAVKSIRIVIAKHGSVRELVPAQAMTIQLHLVMGLLLSAGFIIAGFVD